MSHSERVLENHEDEGSNKNGEQHVIEESERVAQAAAYQERRLKAKKARDAKQAEMNKLLEEKDVSYCLLELHLPIENYSLHLASFTR